MFLLPDKAAASIELKRLWNSDGYTWRCEAMAAEFSEWGEEEVNHSFRWRCDNEKPPLNLATAQRGKVASQYLTFFVYLEETQALWPFQRILYHRTPRSSMAVSCRYLASSPRWRTPRDL